MPKVSPKRNEIAQKKMELDTELDKMGDQDQDRDQERLEILHSDFDPGLKHETRIDRMMGGVAYNF